VEQFPRDHFSGVERRRGAIVLHIVLAAYMFLALALVCDDYFVPSCQRICEGKFAVTVLSYHMCSTVRTFSRVIFLPFDLGPQKENLWDCLSRPCPILVNQSVSKHSRGLPSTVESHALVSSFLDLLFDSWGMRWCHRPVCHFAVRIVIISVTDVCLVWVPGL